MRSKLLTMTGIFFLCIVSEGFASHGSRGFEIMSLMSCGIVSEEYEERATNLFEELKKLDHDFSEKMGEATFSRFITPEQKEMAKTMPSEKFSDLKEHCISVFAALEEETQPLDKRYATPEDTWNTFVTALKDGDIQTIVNSLAGEARNRLETSLQSRPIQELQEIGKLYVDIRLKEDEYADTLGYQEANSIKSDGRNGFVIFTRIGRNWKITTI